MRCGRLCLSTVLRFLHSLSSALPLGRAASTIDTSLFQLTVQLTLPLLSNLNKPRLPSLLPICRRPLPLLCGAMSLRDKACYTLTLVPSLQDPNVLELVENFGGSNAETRYGRVREKNLDGEVYSATLYGESAHTPSGVGERCPGLGREAARGGATRAGRGVGWDGDRRGSRGGQWGWSIGVAAMARVDGAPQWLLNTTRCDGHRRSSARSQSRPQPRGRSEQRSEL